MQEFLGARAPLGLARVKKKIEWKSLGIVITYSISLTLPIGVSGCFKDVATNILGISKVFQECYTCVPKYYKGVTWVFPGCFKVVSRMFQRL